MVDKAQMVDVELIQIEMGEKDKTELPVQLVQMPILLPLLPTVSLLIFGYPTELVLLEPMAKAAAVEKVAAVADVNLVLFVIMEEAPAEAAEDQVLKVVKRVLAVLVVEVPSEYTDLTHLLVQLCRIL
jgi:hypothetical protein